ncbi:MAG TPA: LacI family DNA-binding transcriptional regulator [Terriglobales bacterium]|nr:LacI family DNA-binding transcriptional regulator [Terriglobales bacterium]
MEKTDIVCETPAVPAKRKKKHSQKSSSGNIAKGQPISLKQLAKTLGLSPTTLSLVLNDSEKAQSIPQETKDRIFAAARELNYRPNFFARSLRSQRNYSVGVIIPELSDGYASLVLTGIEDYLLQAGYIYLVTSHRHKDKLIEEHPKLLYERSVEGLIAVDTPYEQDLPLPVVSVSGHHHKPGVTNIILNHDAAAELGLRHLVDFGHRDIAFIKGQSFSSDTEVRWEAIRAAAHHLNIPIVPELVQQMEGMSASPEVGYEAAVRLLKTRKSFTALFAFNDICAIGAIRAFREVGMRVPEDVSVVGFDDIYEAAYHIPALTTIRQPLRRMGMLAAETLVKQIAEPNVSSEPFLSVEPELVVRESTAAARTTRNSGQGTSATS